jgi:acyl carrier protein
MSKEEFVRELEQILEKKTGSLQGHELLEDLEEWDSLAMMSLMAMVDEKAGIQIAARQLAGCKNVNDLYALIQK